PSPRRRQSHAPERSRSRAHRSSARPHRPRKVLFMNRLLASLDALPLDRVGRHPDVVLAVLVVAVIGMMIVPLPPSVLDGLLALRLRRRNRLPLCVYPAPSFRSGARPPPSRFPPLPPPTRPAPASR